MFLDCYDVGKEYKNKIIDFEEEVHDEVDNEDECHELCKNDFVWNDTICTCRIKVEPKTTVDAKSCQDFCQKNPTCKFWTWNEKDYKCFLKNITNNESPRTVTNPGVISGPKYCGMKIFLSQMS